GVGLYHAPDPGRNERAGAVAGGGMLAGVLEAHAEVEVQLVIPGELIVGVHRGRVQIVVTDSRAPIAIADQAVVGQRAQDRAGGVERDNVVNVRLVGHVVGDRGNAGLVVVLVSRVDHPAQG